jgi:tetratricopeptide (TPR) repeat protein
MAWILPLLAWVFGLVQWVCVALAAGACSALGSLTSTNSAALRAEQQYALARTRVRTQGTTNVQNAWQFAQACFEWAEFASNNTQRAAIAEDGIAAARTALQQDPRSAAAHYYLAMDLGQLARTKTLGALKLVSEMEVEFKKAIELDTMIDFAGPHRSLGMLYRDAPGWPASIGSKSKARQHLLKAVELRKEFPENWICLLESYVEWGDKRVAKGKLKEAQDVLKAAREKFGGETWEASWKDWDKRWEAIWDRLYPE